MSLTTRKPTTTEEMLEIVRHHVDQVQRASLRGLAHTASGVPRWKTQRQMLAEQNRLDALLVLLGDLDPRFGVTEAKLRQESYDRIDGAAIVQQDQTQQRALK
jgi:hypothetical protein